MRKFLYRSYLLVLMLANLSVIAIDMRYSSWLYYVPGYAFGAVSAVLVTRVYLIWRSLRSAAYDMSENIARSVNYGDASSMEDDQMLVSTSVSTARFWPPRQAYVEVTAQRGKPIIMYRGMRIFRRNDYAGFSSIDPRWWRPLDRRLVR